MTSKNQQLGFVFGDPLESFEPGIQPTESDVIRMWCHFYDKSRGDSARQMSRKEKSDVIHIVFKSLCDNWMASSRSHLAQLKSPKVIFRSIERLTEKADKIGFLKNLQLNNSKWIEEKKSLFSSVFKIDIPFPSRLNLKLCLQMR